MSVLVKIECQKCEAAHEDELDGVLIIGYKKNQNGSIAYPWWYHDMPTRQAIVGFIDYIKNEFETLAEGTEYEDKLYEFLITLIQEGKISLED